LALKKPHNATISGTTGQKKRASRSARLVSYIPSSSKYSIISDDVLSGFSLMKSMTL
jgi:hypothetical protein